MRQHDDDEHSTAHLINAAPVLFIVITAVGWSIEHIMVPSDDDIILYLVDVTTSNDATW